MEAMSEKQIKDMVRFPQFRVGTIGSVIMAWAIAQGQAERTQAWLNWIMNDKKGPSPSMMEDWTGHVLTRIGWPKDAEPVKE